MKLTRTTQESRITVLHADAARANTGLPFFDHMLATFLKYAGLKVAIEGKGDLKHHTMEDVALTLGAFVRKATPATCVRYGERVIPMDDALVQSVLDLGGRPFFVGKLPGRLYTHWFRSFATAAECTLHLRVLRGGDRHHITEAAFKATGMALGEALADSGTVFSTKGRIQWEES
ncbi:MAG: imidazoleglycerol-phosphate dehydratase [Archangiaceae bacterium]|nr:imidazoleglycerol-phosphate dehydratase [Archangiaceae bacterium]